MSALLDVVIDGGVLADTHLTLDPHRQRPGYRPFGARAGGRPAAHPTDGHRTVDGISFPTRRRVYLRRPDGQVAQGPASVAIDVLDLVAR